MIAVNGTFIANEKVSDNQQIVLVTGASSGIGKAIAEFLAEKGYYVFASARSMDNWEVLPKSCTT